MPYTVDEALLESINRIDADVLKSANLVNSNLSNGLSHTNKNIADADCNIRREVANGFCDTNGKIASAECDLDRDIYQTSQRTIDTLRDSMERKAIATELNGFNNTHSILGSVDKNGERGVVATERNGTTNLISTMTSSAQNLAAIERNGTTGILETEKQGAQIMLSNERIILENHRLGREMSSQHNAHGIEALKSAHAISSLIANRYSKSEERHSDRHQRLELELARHNASSQLQGSENYSKLQLELCKLDNNLGKDILKTAADAKYQAADIFRQTQVDSAKFEGTVARQHEQVLNNLCRMEAKLEFQAEKNTSAIQLEALRNRSDILCEIKECCCELKREIKNSDYEKLRDKNLVLEFESKCSSGRG